MNSDNESAWQPSIGDLGRSLSETVFVVVDLETSGGSPFAGAGITEIGAVKVCGGKVIREFQSLTNPGTPIPDYITELTGISSAMLQDSPSIESILPTLFEFLGSPLAFTAPISVIPAPAKGEPPEVSRSTTTKTVSDNGRPRSPILGCHADLLSGFTIHTVSQPTDIVLLTLLIKWWCLLGNR